MKKIKAILSDYDGTLADQNGNILQGVKNLIKKIQNKNVSFSLATGRAYYSSIRKVENELEIKGIHILHGGAMIFDSVNNKILLLQSISSESVKKIIKYFQVQKLIFSMETKNSVFVSKKVKGSLHYPDLINQAVSKYKNNEPILKIVIYAKANKLSEKQIELHKKNLQNICSDISIHNFEYFDSFGSDITSEKATKHTGVLEFIKILNLSPDEVVAIGDGHNDYPLFTASGFGIAMANAPKELKEIADLIVSKVTEGGMIEALKYIDENLT
ncbi:hypothetical protein CO005_00590 [Candidatus Roizmanbacteria bacterium CG_4_8_14_3_um_filter_34_9]|uniref:Cof-type HAD-IIB family hydrolase n=3 Tax=Candidatus Roizmaniibacteriota TaxID=1752723 RepID=A0A2M7ATM3_9BACT|nr:MAG: hypothetical protein COT02_04235 [Candidatus Roizmanbacteria bacterium CG07_land_8_20_14_0_80_34_15]PIU73913.1 MAG: hypothetical protein COS77_04270 [Candidatus Roizmanbacteria bacterium CG06_land_8_20_14_3_00_34_14]PIW73583.1 MAG: hypothetical protein CO005_00590 [Candidatus Roizmanbacteria bacterium CG_4_8_14_3_um_filter_34_9]